MAYWTSLSIVRQVAGELGLPAPTSLSTTDDPQISQLLALLNSAGNELVVFYPWEQLIRIFDMMTVPAQDKYSLPADWTYFVNQTQWDRTNRWPLLGPKSPQEWAWLTGGGIASAPRTRYRVYGDKLVLFPVPGSTPANITIEYITKNWLTRADQTAADFITTDTDTVNYNPWMMVKFVKQKFYELKGFDTVAVKADFMRMFMSLTGKDKGGPVLSLSPTSSPALVGPWSVPEGSWPIS